MQITSSTRLFLATCMAIMGSSNAYANTVYSIDTTSTNVYPSGNPLQEDTISGTITTDGTLGVLAASNIVDWNLNLIDDLNAGNDFTLSPANSELVHDFGNALSATPTGLFFDYSISGAEFLIQGNKIHSISSGWNYFCFSATGGWCLAGETISPQYVFTDGVVITGSEAPVGQQPLNQSAVPEPSMLGLFTIGFLVLGGCLHRKQAS